MSPHLHHEVARVRQQDIISHTIYSHRRRASRATVGRHRSVKHRIVQVVAALGACAATGTAVTVSNAHPGQLAVKQQAGHVSAQKIAREIRAYEAKGYVPTSCTVSGTLMRNFRTGQSVTVKL